jgi:hypothetical protein
MAASVDEITTIRLITKGGAVGFALGSIIAVGVAFWPGRSRLTSLRVLMATVLVASVLLWYVVTWLEPLVK